MTNYYVTKNQKGEWKTLKEGATRASSISRTQSQAERKAKVYSKKSGGGEVRIQGRDGRFRDSDTVSPAQDPFPPRDKKH